MSVNHNGLNKGSDGYMRCAWCGDDPLYMKYHDHEWGQETHDERYLFEKICLEGFQAGLSWITILRKRENFRDAFDGFDIGKLVQYSENDVAKLLQNQGIVRHEGKIRAVIENAKAAKRLLKDHASFYQFLQQFRPSAGRRPAILDWEHLKEITQSPESQTLSKALKSYGFRFVGPTTMYAYMQSVGLVNDHIEGCSFRKDAAL